MLGHLVGQLEETQRGLRNAREACTAAWADERARRFFGERVEPLEVDTRQFLTVLRELAASIDRAVKECP